jgi:hypothetical protein
MMSDWKYYMNGELVDEETYNKSVKDHAEYVKEQEQKALDAAKLAAKPEKTRKKK